MGDRPDERECQALAARRGNHSVTRFFIAGSGTIALVLSLSFCAPAHARPEQDIVKVSGAYACGDCRIVLERVAVLNSREARGQPMTESNLARDSRGRYFLGPTVVRGQIAVFDSVGNLLGAIGREGSGPGEFREVNRLRVAAGDSLYVTDGAGGQRITVFAPTREFARLLTIAEPFLLGAFDVQGDGRMLVAALNLNRYRPRD